MFLFWDKTLWLLCALDTFQAQQKTAQVVKAYCCCCDVVKTNCSIHHAIELGAFHCENNDSTKTALFSGFSHR